MSSYGLVQGWESTEYYGGKQEAGGCWMLAVQTPPVNLICTVTDIKIMKNALKGRS